MGTALGMAYQVHFLCAGYRSDIVHVPRYFLGRIIQI